MQFEKHIDTLCGKSKSTMLQGTIENLTQQKKLRYWVMPSQAVNLTMLLWNECFAPKPLKQKSFAIELQNLS